jgi:pimeloyl-ACP methyl ester carboxylesterase
MRPGWFARLVAEVRAPALVVHGDRDRLVRLAASRALVARRADWRLLVLEGVGHIPQLEAPERFAAAVGDFLDAPAAGARGVRARASGATAGP